MSRHAEAALFAGVYTKLPLARVVSVEGTRDPLFRLIPITPSSSRRLDDGSSLTFASFQHRDDALQMLADCIDQGTALGAYSCSA